MGPERGSGGIRKKEVQRARKEGKSVQCKASAKKGGRRGANHVSAGLKKGTSRLLPGPGDSDGTKKKKKKKKKPRLMEMSKSGIVERAVRGGRTRGHGSLRRAGREENCRLEGRGGGRPKNRSRLDRRKKARIS